MAQDTPLTPPSASLSEPVPLHLLPRALGTLAPLRAGFPSVQTSLVGRKAEIASLRARLTDPQQRLITVLGPGGVGKTRLAIAASESVVDVFPAGGAFVSLAALNQTDQAPAAIASVLGVRGQPESSTLQAVLTALGDQRLLLVLDNIEHLIDARFQRLVSQVLHECPGVTVLATSREPLHLAVEQRVVVAPLAVPASNDQTDVVARLDAVKLFLARARSVVPDFAPKSDDVRTIGEICRRADGLPLAIELAAAWIRVFSPAALLAQMGERLPLLTGSPSDQPARFRTMHDAIAWSYDRLPEDEAALLRRLSVFRGGFPLEAAERLAEEAAGDTIGSARSLLAALCDKNLIFRAEAIGATQRFGMLETVREFALLQLTNSPDLAAARAAHATFYCDLAERAEPDVLGADENFWFAVYDTEAGNLREAISWGLAHDGELALRTLTALWGYWSWRHVDEGQRLLTVGMAQAQTAPLRLRARAARALAALAALAGDHETCSALTAEILAQSPDLDDRWLLGEVYWYSGAGATLGGDYAHGAQMLDQALACFHQPASDSERSIRAYARSHRGLVARMTGDFDLGDALCQESVAELREVGGASVPIIVLSDYAGWLLARGDNETARELLHEALTIAAHSHSSWLTAAPLTCLALIDAEEGHAQRAARRLGAISTMAERLGLALPVNFRMQVDQATALAEEALGRASYLAAWETGRRNPLPVLQQAIAGDAGHDSPGADGTPRPHITRREREVLELIVAGRTDREIATALFISERTASKHVSTILQKLDAVSRAEAAVRAVRLGLA